MFADEKLKYIQELKDNWLYEQALNEINKLLKKDPLNKDLLLLVSEIYYLIWDYEKAEKPLDSLLLIYEDPIVYYVKSFLAFQKWDLLLAKEYIKKVIDYENPEFMRLYWLIEFKLGNKEKWIDLLNKAFDLSPFDAQIIIDLIQLNVNIWNYEEAKKLIFYYDKIKTDWLIKFYDWKQEYYEEIINLFREFLNIFRNRWSSEIL